MWIHYKAPRPLTGLRLKRLLLLAKHGGDCKSWYSSYCQDTEGYWQWMIGHAWLTEKGEAKLQELLNA